MSFINYPKKKRALEIIKDVHRVLKKGGVCRFGVQDLELICTKYLSGEFDCERVNRWFGHQDGYVSNGKKNKYVYDYKTLSEMFYYAGFIWVSKKLGYREHFLSPLNVYDNREGQMFYLEAIK
jgi:predicted SAM-dependent methyltransferase